MKLFTAIFILLSFQAFTQYAHSIHIDSIPSKGLILEQGWKFKKGDSLYWANKNYNDNNWLKINPNTAITKLPQIFDNDIKWLRIHLNVRKKLKKPVGIAINQAGASEIYLNGNLIYEYGNFDVDSNKVIAYDPLEIPIHLPIDTIGHYTLSVRYRLQPSIKYTTIYGLNKNNFFKASLVDLVPTLHHQRFFNTYYKGLEIFSIGAILMLFIFHLALFIYQRDNKTMLFLVIYLLGTTITRILKVVGQSEHLIENRFFILNLSNAMLALVIVLLAAVVYQIARERYDKFFYFLIVYEIGYVFVSVSSHDKPYQTLMLLISLIYSFVVLSRLVIKGSNKGIKGFTILGTFIGINILSLMVITLSILLFNYGISPLGHNDLTIDFSPYWVDIIFTLGSLSIPIGLSLVIGIENRETNKELKSQLILNEILKDQAIRQEIEKQHILENQNEILETQVTERTAELHHSLETLKSTQAQLIQSEKMASLGELTAGIAHEIQNPLNFVNNFSDISNELIDEMVEELEKGYTEEAKVISADIKQNLEKIHHHGKRASDIVKGMLEHSRKSTGEKVETDINALCDEYVRLSYHGLRAKDKSFNATFEIILDSDLPKIKIIPQDIGRVLLNLINNAFWAVNDNKIKLGEGDYRPKVTVTTKSHEKAIEIIVKDNGNGIPKENIGKIFQPFFTTKPTGQGTGLGLSLSYDIIKAHGGTLEVESAEGLFTEFVIKLNI